MRHPQKIIFSNNIIGGGLCIDCSLQMYFDEKFECLMNGAKSCCYFFLGSI